MLKSACIEHLLCARDMGPFLQWRYLLCGGVNTSLKSPACFQGILLFASGLENKANVCWHLLCTWASVLDALRLLALCPSDLCGIILEWDLPSVPKAESAPPKLRTLI